MKPVNAFIGLIASAVFLSSGSAMAVDSKVYPGSMCQPDSPSDADSLRYSAETVVNQSVRDIFVTCPIVRDNTDNTNGTASAFVNVQSASGKSLICSLSSYRKDNSSSAIDSSLASTTSNNPVSLNVDINSSAVQGSYILGCRLPLGGRIFSYFVNEF